MSVKLFVGGLSFSTSTDGLRAAFARFGAVQSAAVMTDRETGRSRGFGFVEMATTEEAERAISGLNGSQLDGRMIRVDKATPRGTAAPRPPRPAGGPPRSYGDRPAGGGGFGAPRFGGPGGAGRGPGGGFGGGRSAGAPGFGAPGGGFGDKPGRGAQRRGAGGGWGDKPGGTRKGPGRKGAGKRGPGQDGGTGRGRPGSDGEYRWGR